MHQRIAMHAFQRRPGSQRAVARHAEEGRRFDDEDGPEPLALTEGGITHGLRHPRRGEGIQRQQPVQQGIGFGGAAGEGVTLADVELLADQLC